MNKETKPEDQTANTDSNKPDNQQDGAGAKELLPKPVDAAPLAERYIPKPTGIYIKMKGGIAELAD